MSNEVTIEELENVTPVVIFGEKFNVYGNINDPLFLAVDIAEMIEYDKDKTHQMLNLVDDDEKLTDTINRGGQKREVWFVTEYGLYELLMQSRKPLAKRFKLAIKKALKQLRLGANAVRVDKNNCYTFYGAKIIFRNFSGEEGRFNRAGDRNFGIIIDDPNLAEDLKQQGWNIKTLPARDEDETPKSFVKVAVRYDNFPPKVYKISGMVRTLLDDESIGSLDGDEFAKVDVTISPSQWEVNGNTGIKAYLKTMYVTLVDDELANFYNNQDSNELPFL